MDLDLESPEMDSQPVPVNRVNPPVALARRTRTHTSRLVTSDARAMIAAAYRGEIRSMIRWRDIWKRFGDGCEAAAKGLTGVSAILAFASSAIRDPRIADILSFTSGSVGTLGLVLLTYSGYAIHESRERTVELNGVLESIGVTPVPDIASSTSARPSGD
jgi:hypothetical protein